MQPYPYVPYPNAAGTAIPIHYMAPVVYPPNSSTYINQSYDPYALMAPSTIQPIQYLPPRVRYPPPPVSTLMPIVHPQPQPPPHPRNQQLYTQQFQHPQVYYLNSNGVNPAAPSNSKPMKNVPKKNQTSKSLNSNNNFDNLLKHKGTKVRASKIYRSSKRNHGFQDDSSDDEAEQVPLDSFRPPTLQQSKKLTAPIQRIPSAASSCSHCSTCTNCSCSECRHKNKRHTYDDCPECRSEREFQKTHTRQHKPK